MAQVFRVSIGLVFYNEAHRIERFVDELKKAIDGIGSGFSFELICIDNHSSDESSNLLRKKIESLGWDFRFERSLQNNMGRARDRILRLASESLVYFIDIDVSINSENLLHMLRRSKLEFEEDQICSWAGPIEVSEKGDFQVDLRFLQKTWWGHMGSAQMKSSFSGCFVDHAPTGHLLVKKNAYLLVGSFEPRLDRSGEDLEIHQRLCDQGFKISWVPEAKAIHDVAQSSKVWLAKSYKYGLAQTQIAKLRPRNWFRWRCFPFYFSVFFVALIFAYPSVVAMLFGAYLLSIAMSSISLSRARWRQIFWLLMATHCFYFLGEIAGIFRPLANAEISTTKI